MKSVTATKPLPLDGKQIEFEYPRGVAGHSAGVVTVDGKAYVVFGWFEKTETDNLLRPV